MPDLVLSRSLEPVPVHPAPLPAAEQTIHPLQIVTMLRRHWLLILSCGVIFAAVAYIGSVKLLAKQFTASGLIAIDSQSVAIPVLEGALKGNVLPDPTPVVRSEADVLQSPALVRSVVQKLKLDQDPAFNPALRPPGLRARIGEMLPAPIRSEAMKLGILPYSLSNQALSPEAAADLTVGNVARKLGIKAEGQSMVISVTFTGPSPDRAAQVVNTLMQEYIAGKQSAHNQANQQANSALTDRLKQVRDEINALEKKIQDTRQKYELVQTRSGSVSQQQVEELATALTHASTDRAALEAEYARASALASAGEVPQASAQALSSTTISRLREQEAAAERRVAELSQTFGPGYPALRSAEAQLGSARKALGAETRRIVVGLGAQVQAARQREADLRKQLADMQAKASQLGTVQAELTQLQKDADARRSVYQTLLLSTEQTQPGKNGPEQVGSHIVSPATPPAKPSSPRPLLAAGFGLLGGFAFGSCLALVRRKGTAFADAEELAGAIGFEPLAIVPRMRGRSTLLPQLVVTQPTGPEAEALRALRARLRFAAQGRMPRVLMFTASASGEGSSSLAAAFARQAALEGLRVLLVEGDLANPSLSRLLQVPPSNGLVETLIGREYWHEARVRDRQSPLDMLLADEAQADAGRLLESMQLQSLLAETRDEYSFVVLDAQPVDASPDTMVLAHSVDAVVLVVEAGSSTREEVESAIGSLAGVTSRAPAVVLNKG